MRNSEPATADPSKNVLMPTGTAPDNVVSGVDPLAVNAKSFTAYAAAVFRTAVVGVVTFDKPEIRDPPLRTTF